MWRLIRFALLAAIVCWQGLHWWLHRPVHQPDGALTVEEPLQEALPQSAAPILRGDFSLLPQAHYHITARLLSSKPYRFGREAELAPLDFTLGWGPMSDNRVLETLEISQSSRFFLRMTESSEPPVTSSMA